MKFNINHNVKVKLTPFGIDILRFEHAILRVTWPKTGDFEHPKTDVDGYVEYQLHHLMRVFGPHMNMGSHVPFETEIQIGDPQ